MLESRIHWAENLQRYFKVQQQKVLNLFNTWSSKSFTWYIIFYAKQIKPCIYFKSNLKKHIKNICNKICCFKPFQIARHRHKKCVIVSLIYIMIIMAMLAWFNDDLMSWSRDVRKSQHDHHYSIATLPQQTDTYSLRACIFSYIL